MRFTHRRRALESPLYHAPTVGEAEPQSSADEDFSLPRLGGASVHRAAAVAGHLRVEQLRDVHGVEYVAAIAEVAMYFDLPPFGEHRAALRLAQTLQHAADPLARTSTSKEHRCRLEQPHIVLVEQP